jgi:hypothetical protein
MVAKEKCVKEWALQSYIDGELDTDSLALVENHLRHCSKCAQRLVERKQRVAKVLDALALTHRKTAKIRNPKRHMLLWAVGVAASLLIALALSGVFVPDYEVVEGSIAQQCEWVEVDGENLMPDFESPNKLYRMRAIAIKEFDVEGNTSERYLVKQCQHNDQVN